MTDTFDSLRLHHSVIEAASWRLCSELARRHPDEVRIYELHPGGGQYDCLSLITTGSSPRTVLDANRWGSIHTEGGAWTWTDYLTAADPRSFLKQVERAAGLTAPPQVPPSTRTTLVWRTIAHALASEMLGIRGLCALNGMVDSSGYESGPRDWLFAVFPEAQEAARHDHPSDLHGNPAYRFWFLLWRKPEELTSQSERPAFADPASLEPRVAIETTTGRCWSVDGSAYDLHALYSAGGRKLAATVGTALQPALA